MISVQNLLQPLNGNKKLLLVLFLLSSVLIQSCSSWKFSQEQLNLEEKYQRHQTENPIVVVPAKDSVQQTVVNLPEKIDSLASIYPFIQKEKYNIAYILPLYLNEIYDEEFKQKRISKLAQEYYMGAKLALEDSVPNLGLNLQVQIFDNYSGSDSSISHILSLIDKDSFDLIVGPFLNTHMDEFSAYSQMHMLPIISPLSIKKGFLENPYFISCRPAKYTHLEKSSQLMTKHFKNYHLLVLASDNTELEYIKEKVMLYSDSTTFKSMHFMVVDHGNWGKAEYLHQLAKDSNLIYIPTHDVVVINSVVTNLIGVIDFDKEEQKNKINVLAPYKWLNKSAVEINMLDKLNSYFTSEPILDFSDSSTIEFVKSYRQAYKTEPNNYAWLGYQGVLLYSQLMVDHGKYIQRALIEKETACDGFTFLRRKAGNGFEKSTIWLFKFEEHKLKRVK